MFKFAVFDSNGILVRSGVAQEETQTQGQAGENESLFVWSDDRSITAATHYLKDGVVHEYTEEQKARLNSRPQFFFQWSLDSMSWVDPRSLSELASAKWSEIKAAREAAEFSPFAWNGNTFDADSESQRRIQGAVQLAVLAQAVGQPFEIDWTLADNSTITLTGADMVGVGQALAVHVSTAHAIARTLRAQIEAATTVEEVEAVQWPSP